MTDLQQGGNAPVTGNAVAVRVEGAPAAGVDLDVSAYLLTDAGKVRGDQDMVFYNQASGGDGAVRFSKGGGALGTFDIDLGKLPSTITRIVFCVTIDEAVARRQTLSQVAGARISAGDIMFTPALAQASEAAMIFGELYLRNGAWKFRAVGQGFNGGLAPLARSFGIDVADEAPAVAPPPAAAPPPPPPPPPSPPAVAASPPSPPPTISLSKVSLDKPGQSISLEKRGASFGDIVVNLNWSRPEKKKSFFGGGSSGALDLDLGCLFEMANGDKMVVQALGRMFGSFHDWPYIELSGDDRTGDISAGETMRINGAKWAEIKRIAVFALIYEGAPNWNQTDGVVTVTAPGQPPIEVRMTEGRNDKRLCGVVMLENKAGALSVTRIVDYFQSQSELDRAFGWGMNWKAGSK